MNNFKKVFIICLLCIVSQISANIVQPINPQEGVWNVMTRIAQAVDLLADFKPIDCDFFITQSDIGLGNVFTITGNNAVYCLAETVTFNTGAAITISGSSSGITVDLGGNIIDGGENDTQGILIQHGAQNIIIQNGIIQRIGGSGNNGYAIADDTGGSIIENVIIRNMNFNTNSQGAIIFGLGTQPSVNDLLIENCIAQDSGGLFASTGGAVVRGCIFNENRGPLFASDLILSGLSAVQMALFATVEDCIVTSSFGQVSSAQIMTNFAQNSRIAGCIAQGSLTNGFRFSQFQNIALINCIAQSSGDSGFTFTAPLDAGSNVSNVVLQDCVAQSCGVLANVGHGFEFAQTTNGGFLSLKLLGCIAQQNAQNGFFLDHNPGTMEFSGILFESCYAVANGANGFLIKRSLGNGEWTDLVFDGCMAQQNSGHGFAIENQASDDAISNIIFRDCTAQSNQGGSFGGSTFDGDGFGIGSSTLNAGPINDVLFQGCIAETNINDGFDFSATTSDIQIIDCCALRNSAYGINSTGTQVFFFGNTAINNTTGDYVGVTDPTQIVSYSFAGALNGAGKWVNVKS